MHSRQLAAAESTGGLPPDGGLARSDPMKKTILFRGLVAWGLALASLVVRAVEPAAPAGPVIAASDPRFRYEGRLDFADPTGPVVIWSGSRISLDFEGARLALRFAGAHGQNFFNAQVDGTSVVVAACEGGEEQIEVPAPGPGRHHLTLFKRSEASAGVVRFTGVALTAGAQAWAPPVPSYKLRMEFFGDSITVGACNEDGAADQWEDRRTHNNALSYSTLTAAAFAADYRCLAVSGMGVAAGFTELKAGQAWNRLYPRADAPLADLQAWQPDVLLINLGENDHGYPSSHGLPFPSGYTAGYVTMVKAIRAAYPHTHIVLLRGGMFGGAQSAPLRAAWEAVVKAVEAADPAVSHFVFTHWSSTHPRVSDDRAMADELTAWLTLQPFMRPAG
jgi:lysophospholipase L1-like esterase